jgi:hypothetical protein
LPSTIVEGDFVVSYVYGDVTGSVLFSNKIQENTKIFPENHISIRVYGDGFVGYFNKETKKWTSFSPKDIKFVVTAPNEESVANNYVEFSPS